MPDDLISTMKVCPTTECVKSYRDSVVIFEQEWRRDQCQDMGPGARSGPGGFVFAARVSQRLAAHMAGAVHNRTFCHVEKFIETVCLQQSLSSRTLPWQRLGWLSIQPAAGMERLVNDSYGRDGPSGGQLFHPVKDSQMQSLPPTTGPVHEHCTAGGARYAHPEFRAPAAGAGKAAACRQGCWVLNSSDPSLLCDGSGPQQPLQYSLWQMFTRRFIR